MPLNKNAFNRYVIIDQCIKNNMRKAPSWENIQEAIYDKLGLEVSKSSIDKDIRSLRDEHGAPILFDKQKGGYVYTDKNYSFRDTISEQDEWILDFAAAAMHVYGDGPLRKKFQKISKKMTRGTADAGENNPAFGCLEVEGGHTKIDYQWLFELYRYTMNNEVVKIVYAPFGRPKKEHVVSPYFLKQYRNRWYLIACSHEKKLTIIFALDRIEKLEKSKEKYQYDRNFDRSGFLKHSFGLYHSHEFPPEKVRLLIGDKIAPYVLTLPWHSSQKVISHDKNGLLIELEIYCKGNFDLISKILSYGEEVVVLGPHYLREEILNKANAMIEKYISL